MVEFKSAEEINQTFEGISTEALAGNTLLDRLAYTAVFGAAAPRSAARAVIRDSARRLGIRPASIQPLYERMGKEECGGFTVPAINIRGLTYHIAAAIFRTAIALKAGPFIFEIARSEIGYTDQPPDEYATIIMAAAIKEGWQGPLFIQGDHYQIKPQRYKEDSKGELEELKALIEESVAAGFYNIDIDASTLVDLSRADVVEQQRPNFEVTAELTRFIRAIEPEGITISIGGEIGEVGGKNSTVEELRAFMDGYLNSLGDGIKGISKISVQTGTTHGGVVLPDGSVAKVKVDFHTIERLSTVARREYGLAGVVQHGASTLPEEAFHLFPERGTAEIHLATGFQNIIYESPAFPQELKQTIYEYLKEHFADQKKPDETEEQFIYRTRKWAFRPFKKAFWDIPEESLHQIVVELEGRFRFLFEKLNLNDTAHLLVD